MQPARKPLIDNRLRSVLMGVGACMALLVAYHMAIGRDPIPPDTRIVFQGCAATPCRAVRLEIGHDGATTLMSDSGVYRYKISDFALRHFLRVFHRQAFLDRDVAAYDAGGRQACMLDLEMAHRKTAPVYACEAPPTEIAGPLTAVEQATRFREIAAGDAITMRDLRVERVH